MITNGIFIPASPTLAPGLKIDLVRIRTHKVKLFTVATLAFNIERQDI